MFALGDHAAAGRTIYYDDVKVVFASADLFKAEYRDILAMTKDTFPKKTDAGYDAACAKLENAKADYNAFGATIKEALSAEKATLDVLTNASLGVYGDLTREDLTEVEGGYAYTWDFENGFNSFEATAGTAVEGFGVVDDTTAGGTEGNRLLKAPGSSAHTVYTPIKWNRNFNLKSVSYRINLGDIVEGSGDQTEVVVWQDPENSAYRISLFWSTMSGSTPMLFDMGVYYYVNGTRSMEWYAGTATFKNTSLSGQDNKWLTFTINYTGARTATMQIVSDAKDGDTPIVDKTASLSFNSQTALNGYPNLDIRTGKFGLSDCANSNKNIYFDDITAVFDGEYLAASKDADAFKTANADTFALADIGSNEDALSLIAAVEAYNKLTDYAKSYLTEEQAKLNTLQEKAVAYVGGASNADVEALWNTVKYLTPANKTVLNDLYNAVYSSLSGRDTDSDAPINVVVVGHSMVEGTGCVVKGQNGTKTYPAQLQQMLDEAYGEGRYNLTNVAVGGARIKDWLDIELNREVSEFDVVLGGTSMRGKLGEGNTSVGDLNPDVILILIGGNDINVTYDGDADWKTGFKNRYTQLINIYRSFETAPAIIPITDAAWIGDVPGSGHTTGSGAAVTVEKELFAELELTYIDLFTYTKEAFLAYQEANGFEAAYEYFFRQENGEKDEQHYSPAGYKCMAEGVFEVFKNTYVDFTLESGKKNVVLTDEATAFTKNFGDLNGYAGDKTTVTESNAATVEAQLAKAAAFYSTLAAETKENAAVITLKASVDTLNTAFYNPVMLGATLPKNAAEGTNTKIYFKMENPELTAGKKVKELGFVYTYYAYITGNRVAYTDMVYGSENAYVMSVTGSKMHSDGTYTIAVSVPQDGYGYRVIARAFIVYTDGTVCYSGNTTTGGSIASGFGVENGYASRSVIAIAKAISKNMCDYNDAGLFVEPNVLDGNIASIITKEGEDYTWHAVGNGHNIIQFICNEQNFNAYCAVYAQQNANN